MPHPSDSTPDIPHPLRLDYRIRCRFIVLDTDSYRYKIGCNSIDIVEIDVLNEVRSFQMLEQAMLWAFSRKPPASLTKVVTQDEFTHDVVIEVSKTDFLVFDTT